MDLVATGKQAILVPTPGQAEQEYLAEYLMTQKIFYSVPQQKMDIVEALKELKRSVFTIPVLNFDEMNKSVITDWLARLQKNSRQ